MRRPSTEGGGRHVPHHHARDPLAPVGTPSGLPDHFSWHAIVHGIVTPLAFVAALSASLVLAVPLGSRCGRRWLLGSRAMPATVVLVLVVPGLGGFSLRLALATALVLGWLTAVSLHALVEEDAS